MPLTAATCLLLVVNTASKCGFTPQFEALEALHAKYRDEGFAELGLPSGDFKAQEFDDEGDIAKFCALTYGLEFQCSRRCTWSATPPRRCTNSWRPPPATRRSGTSTST